MSSSIGDIGKTKRDACDKLVEDFFHKYENEVKDRYELWSDICELLINHTILVERDLTDES